MQLAKKTGRLIGKKMEILVDILRIRSWGQSALVMATLLFTLLVNSFRFRIGYRYESGLISAHDDLCIS